jgi:hypothetical protein
MIVTIKNVPDGIPEEVQMEIGRRIALEFNVFGYNVNDMRVEFGED